MKKYEDYITLLGDWGTKAFTVGVRAFRSPLEENLIIDKVPNSTEYNINCNKNIETINGLELNGLVEVSRESYEKTDYKTKAVSTILKNQLKCKAVDMLHFLECQYHSVLLDMTYQEHIVYPETTRVNTCANCGKFNSHNIKNCPSTQICTRCLLSDHTIDSCKSECIKCINCGKAHSCNFRGCWSLVNEIKKNHPFTFGILLGEKVKSNPYEVLNISEYYTDPNLTEIETNLHFNSEIISDMVQQHAYSMHSRLNDHETRINTNSKSIAVMGETLKSHGEQLELHTKILNEHSEQIAKCVQNTNEIKISVSNIENKMNTVSDSNAAIAESLIEFKALLKKLSTK